jgi:hypothetical protein
MSRNQVMRKYLIPIQKKLVAELEAIKKKTSDKPWYDMISAGDKVRFIHNQMAGLKISSKEYANLYNHLEAAQTNLNSKIKLREKQLKNMDKYIEEQARIEFELSVIELEILMNK